MNQLSGHMIPRVLELHHTFQRLHTYSRFLRYVVVERSGVVLELFVIVPELKKAVDQTLAS
jgi:hypothetical protein